MPLSVPLLFWDGVLCSWVASPLWWAAFAPQPLARPHDDASLWVGRLRFDVIIPVTACGQALQLLLIAAAPVPACPAGAILDGQRLPVEAR